MEKKFFFAWFTVKFTKSWRMNFAKQWQDLRPHSGNLKKDSFWDRDFYVLWDTDLSNCEQAATSGFFIFLWTELYNSERTTVRDNWMTFSRGNKFQQDFVPPKHHGQGQVRQECLHHAASHTVASQRVLVFGHPSFQSPPLWPFLTVPFQGGFFCSTHYFIAHNTGTMYLKNTLW